MKTKSIFFIFIFYFICPFSFSQTASLMNVNTWAYQLQNININQVVNDSTFELIVIDYSIDGTDAGKFTQQEITQIKNSGKKAIAYISIGEAENYRYYWQSVWNTTPPIWLGPENPDWAGNFKVKFWDPQWQNIIFSYIDTIINQGYDGVYMDIIDAYYYWQVENPLEPMADSLMIQFVLNIRNHISSITTNTFYIIPQNGEDVINSTNVSQNLKTNYFNVINAVGVEDVFFYGSLNEDNPYNPDNYRIQQLQEYQANNKRIFSIEYLTQLNKIQQYYTVAQNENYVPYSCVRALDLLCNGIQVGIKEKQKDNAIEVYPNPTSGVLGIKIKDLGFKNADLKIFDVFGKILYQSEITNQKSEIHLDLPSGMCFYQVTDNKQFISSGKLIVQ